MKKTLNIFLVVAASLAVSAAYAQTAGPTGSQGTLHVGAKAHRGGLNWKVEQAALAEILPKLNLTADQQSQMDALKSKTVEDLKAALKETKGDRVARQAKMQEIGQNYHKAFFAILTPAQTKQFRAEHKEFMKKWHEEHKKPATTTPSPAPSTTPSTGSGK